MKINNKVVLIAILIIGFFFRIYHIKSNPPELYHDEIINYVSAKSIIETGKDLEGNLLPFFSDRVEFRPPLYGYISYISARIFGEGIFAIRFPAVIFGLGTMIALYYLCLELTKNKTAALISAFILSVIPWHIHYSRIGWEPAPVLLLLLLGLLFTIKGINYRQSKLVYLAFSLFGLTVYTYHGAPLFVLLFMSVILYSNFHYLKQNKKIIIISILIYSAVILPYAYLILSEPTFFNRANRIATFSQGINQQSVYIFFRNYLSHYSLDFLFFKGDPNLRHGVQTGVLYLWMLPFLFIGFYYFIFKNKVVWIKSLILLWLLIFPIGASLANDGYPHAHRSLIGMPLFCVLAGTGMWLFFNKVYKSKYLLIVSITLLTMIILYSLFNFSVKYFTVYPKLSQTWWYYGHKDIFIQIRKLGKNYRRVCLGHINYWEAKPIVYYYLRDSNLQTIEGTKDKICNQAGSIVTLKISDTIPNNARLRVTTHDLNGIPLYRIVTMD